MRPCFLLTLLAATALPSCSRAPASPRVAALGTGSSNGGNSAVDEKSGEVSFLDLKRLPGTVTLVPRDLPAYALLRERLARSQAYRGCAYLPSYEGMPATPVAEHVFLALDGLRLRLVMNGTPLPDPGDKGVVVLPSSDHKVARFALQIIKSGELWVDGRLLEKMSDTDIAAFLLHESLIRLWYFDPSNIESSRSDTGYELGRLEATDRIADIVNLTFSGSRFAKHVTPPSLASKFCEAGFRVSAAVKRGMIHQPLPSAEHRSPKYPRNLVLFQNMDCRAREIAVVGNWETRELRNAQAQELSNFPDGSIDGEGEHRRLRDRAATPRFWTWWLLPELGGRGAAFLRGAKGFRTEPVRIDGYVDSLPVREMFHGKIVAGASEPPGRLLYLNGGGIESLWLEPDANVPFDERKLGFSLWGGSGGKLEYTGDGGAFLRGTR